jgi:hypothetical protein
MVDLDTMETKTVGLYKPDRLSFLEFVNLKRFGHTDEFVYFLAFGCQKYLASQSKLPLAWLDDNRFLTLETHADGTQSVYSEDFRADKTWVDQGRQEYQYLRIFKNM